MDIVTKKKQKSIAPFYYVEGKGWYIDGKEKIGGKFVKISKRWFASIKEAREAYVYLVEEKKKATEEAPRTELSWEEFHDRFLDYRRTQVKGSSLAIDRQRMISFFNPLFEGKKVFQCFKQEMAAKVQRNAQNAKMNSKNKNKTLGMYLAMLEFAFNREYLENDGDYRRCKAEICKIRAVEEEETERRSEKTVLTEEQFQTLLGAINDPVDKMLTLTMFETGLRIGEALALTPGDFDFDANMLCITKTVSTDEFRNAKVYNRTKTALGKRSIPMTSSYSAIAKAYILKLGIPSDGLMFPPMEKGAKVLDSSAYRRRLASYCRESHIPVVTPHCLRHSFATRLSTQCHTDADRQARAYVMGHSVLVDEQVYTAHNQLENAKVLIGNKA